MNQRSGHTGHTTPTPDSDINEALRQVVAGQIGPRKPGVVYSTTDGVYEVLDVTTDRTDALAGSSDGTDILTALAHLVARLATADTNPALRTLPFDQQKAAQHHGEQAQYHLTDEWLHQHASEASAAIDGI